MKVKEWKEVKGKIEERKEGKERKWKEGRKWKKRGKERWEEVNERKGGKEDRRE